MKACAGRFGHFHRVREMEREECVVQGHEAQSGTNPRQGVFNGREIVVDGRNG